MVDGQAARPRGDRDLDCRERPLAAHDTMEMPVWGPMFRAFESDSRVRERITNLVAHVELLQLSSTASGDAGSRLFRTYCASCHGTSAHGPVRQQKAALEPLLFG